MSHGHSKTIADGIGIIGPFIAAVSGMLEPVFACLAALVGIVWGCLRIWESKTVQGWFK